MMRASSKSKARTSSQNKCNRTGSSSNNNNISNASNNSGASSASTSLKLPPIRQSAAPPKTTPPGSYTLSSSSQHQQTTDKRSVLTVDVGTDQNSIFSGLAQYLLNNNAHGNAESRWIHSRVRVNPNEVTDTLSPCCIKCSGINLYLGEKAVTERLVAEAHYVCARARRNGGVLSVCKHMKKKDLIPDEEYTSFPNRIVVAFFPQSKTLTLKAVMAKALVDTFTAAVAFSQITPETYILIPRKEHVHGLVDQRHQWLRSIASRQSAGEQPIFIAKSSHGAKGRGIRIVKTVPGAALDTPPSTPASSSSSVGGGGGGGGGATAAARSAALQYSTGTASRPLCMDVAGFLEDFDRNTAEANPWVVQMYVGRPLLYDGRKFDMRAWVLLTPRLEIFVWKEGVCRMCSEPYAGSDLNQIYAHISNHCIQERSPLFGRREADNLITFEEMDRRFFSKLKRPAGATAGGNASWNEDIAPQMHRQIRDCFKTIKSQVMATFSAGAIDAFQLFGFDFMLDDMLKLWLLEVNGAPGTSDSLLKPIIEDLAETIVYDMLPSARPKVPRANSRSRPNWFQKIAGKDDW